MTADEFKNRLMLRISPKNQLGDDASEVFTQAVMLFQEEEAERRKATEKIRASLLELKSTIFRR